MRHGSRSAHVGIANFAAAACPIKGDGFPGANMGGLTGPEKPLIPMYEPMFDIRVIAKSLKLAAGTDTLSLEILDKVKSSTEGATARLLQAALSHMPDPVVF